MHFLLSYTASHDSPKAGVSPIILLFPWPKLIKNMKQIYKCDIIIDSFGYNLQS